MAGKSGPRPHFPTIFIYFHPHLHICSYIFPKFPNLLPWPFPSHNGSAIVTEAPRGCRGLHAACRGSPTASDPPGGPRHTRHVRSRPQLATDHWDTRINLGFVLFDVGFGYYGGCTKENHNWLVVDLPLWKILVSRDDYSQYMKNISQWSGLAGKILTRKPHIQWENS